jgi:hypothetical protein
MDKMAFLTNQDQDQQPQHSPPPPSPPSEVQRPKRKCSSIIPSYSIDAYFSSLAGKFSDEVVDDYFVESQQDDQNQYQHQFSRGGKNKSSRVRKAGDDECEDGEGESDGEEEDDEGYHSSQHESPNKVSLFSHFTLLSYHITIGSVVHYSQRLSAHFHFLSSSSSCVIIVRITLLPLTFSLPHRSPSQSSKSSF